MLLTGDQPRSPSAWPEEELIPPARTSEGRSRGKLGTVKARMDSFGVLDPKLNHWLTFLQSAREPCSKTLYLGSQQHPPPHLLSRCQGPVPRSLQPNTILLQAPGGIQLATAQPRLVAFHHRPLPSRRHPNTTVVRASRPHWGLQTAGPSCLSSLAMESPYTSPLPSLPLPGLLNHLIPSLSGTQTKAGETPSTIKNDASQQTK